MESRKRDRVRQFFGRKAGAMTMQERTQGSGSIAASSSPIHDHVSGVLDQGYPPQPVNIKQRNAIIATETAKSPESRWAHAYAALRDREPDLVAAYERHLAATAGSSTEHLSPEMFESVARSKLQDREAHQMVINLGKKPVKVREQGERIVKFILWSKDTISPAGTADPYTALVWSGVSIVLPTVAMIEGLEFVSDLLRLYRFREDVSLGASETIDHKNCVQAIERLYSQIFEYQARMVCHLSHASFRRGLRGTMRLDDWEGMLQKIRASDEECTQYITIADRTRELELLAKESSQMMQSIDIQNRILRMVERRQQHRQDDKEAELLETLASDYKSDKDFVSRRVQGTCEWFFEDPKFLEWRDSKTSSILWVSAGPGCGKSVLSRALVDERRVCTSAMASTVCYFFFKDGQEQRTHGTDAISAILHQFLEKTAIFEHALSSHKSYGEKLRHAFSELWDILVRSAKDPEAGEIVCVVDALDECEQHARGQMVAKLVDFFSAVEPQGSTPYVLKFLITSRPYEDLEESFRPLLDISTFMRFDGDDKNHVIGQEINLVIDDKIPTLMRNFGYEDCRRISDRLKRMENRTYLWLHLTFDIITSSRSQYSKRSSMDTLLSDLPTKVTDAYEAILSKSSNKVHARILLEIIIAASRRLTLEEANIALSLATQETCNSNGTLELWELKGFKHVIRSMCGLFVTVHDEKVALIHQTAREFLIEKRQPHESLLNPWQGSLNLSVAHSTMAKICLTYLTFDDFSTPSQQSFVARRELFQLEKRYPLLQYAVSNWVAHYTTQPTESVKDMQKSAETLCDVSLPYQRYWFHISYKETEYSQPPRKICTSLFIASWAALVNLVEVFLDKGADVYSQGQKQYALCTASSRGHYEVVELLLARGADANGPSGIHDYSPLMSASFNGHGQVVRLLLDGGAEVNAQGGGFGNALQTASSQGYIEVVRLLLDRGAEVNAQGGHWGNVLQAASYLGHIEIVRLLLDRGAEVNAQSGDWGNALQAASHNGGAEVVRLLLENHAIVDLPDAQGRTALHRAISRRATTIMQRLLDFGADVKAVDIQGRNCLHYAACGNNVGMVEVLLRQGFDPNYADRDGWTALHWAAKSRSPGAIKVLEAAGAVPSIEAIKGWTPDMVAKFHHNEDLFGSEDAISDDGSGHGLDSKSHAQLNRAANVSKDCGGSISPGEKQYCKCNGCFLKIGRSSDDSESDLLEEADSENKESEDDKSENDESENDEADSA